MRYHHHVSLALLTLTAAAAQAKDDRPSRYRVSLGAEVVPSYPGADHQRVQPIVNLDRARGDDQFAFEAPDEGIAVPLINRHGFAFGPALDFQGRRRAKDVGADVPKVGFTVEAGGFLHYYVAPALRLRAEVRQGIGGHRGLIGEVGADYIARDADRWLFSIGPRMTLTSDKYTRAYFGVTPATTTRTGLPAYRPDGGLQSFGATASALRQFGPHFGLYGYAKYDRLVDDASRSPLVRGYGSLNQFSGGLALSYTFGRR